MDTLGTSPLADLHVHLGGCIGYSTCLEMLLSCPSPHWESYERGFEQAYGRPSDARPLLERVAAGDLGARTKFREVFEFRDGDGGQFSKFQAKFNLILVGDMAFRVLREGGSVSESLEHIRPVIESVHAEHKRQGLAHVEMRLYLADTDHQRAHLFYKGVLELFAGLKGLPTTQLVVSLNRADPMLLWPSLEKLALGPHGDHFVGVDFCHVEEGFPPKNLSRFFQAFHGFNSAYPERSLSLVYHVGESFDDKSLESAVRWVVESAKAGVHRLGHAIALGIHPDHYGPHERTESIAERRDQILYDLKYADGLRAHGVSVDEAVLRSELTALEGRNDEETVSIVYETERLNEFVRRQHFGAEQIRQTQAIIEVCPSSNRRIAGILDNAYHPIHRFVEWELPFIIASDDPGLFGVTLKDELETARTMLGWSSKQIGCLVDRAWRHRSQFTSGREGHEERLGR